MYDFTKLTELQKKLLANMIQSSKDLTPKVKVN